MTDTHLEFRLHPFHIYLLPWREDDAGTTRWTWLIFSVVVGR